MILDLVNKLMKPVIIIAVISMTITWAFNVKNVLITEATYNGITMKVVDFRLYLQNLTNAWESNALTFDQILIPREWETVEGSIVDAEFWNSLFNNMAFLFDCLYFPINFILWINRWICWLVKILLALIGWNTSINATTGDYYSTLVKILVWVIENLFIPYV